MKPGVISRGITCPIIRQGDDLATIIVDALYNQDRHVLKDGLSNKSVVGITESIVARSQGNYASIDDIAESVKSICGENATIVVDEPIYSRNRFAIILRGIARAAKKIILVMPETDEVGNVLHNHPFTKMNYDEYYMQICKSENAEVETMPTYERSSCGKDHYLLICALHDYEWASKGKHKYIFTLADILSDKCEYGLLGSNKVDEEHIKLFPTKEYAQKIVEEVHDRILDMTGKDIIVCVYGDGCFKDPVGGIWEFADPITMPAYTHKEIIESTPNELKVKALADDKFASLTGDELTKAVENEIAMKQNLMGKMDSQGTTPRLYRDLLASLMDLTSGSGDRCTPIILIENYFQC